MEQSSTTRITDTRALKALSNPIRLRLLTSLRTEGPQTVGQLAERIGQAPGSVSYHLSQLSAVHLVKKTQPLSGSDRRMSWWESTSDSIQLSPQDFNQTVETAFGRASLAAYGDAYARFANSVPSQSRSNDSILLQHDAILSLTDEEAGELMGELDDVLKKWETRQKNRTQTEDLNSFALILLGFPWIP